MIPVLQISVTMILWAAAFLCFCIGVASLFAGSDPTSVIFQGRNETRKLNQVVSLLHSLQETLEAGLVPPLDRWQKLAGLPEPWGSLSHQSLTELRAAGGSLLPTLTRLRKLAEEHLASLQEARAKASQALAQAMMCAGMVPLFGASLWLLLPGVNESPWMWLFACLLALLVAGGGALWLMNMAESARWGGLAPAERAWILAAQCAGERFLALLRSGTPGDLAWTRACEILNGHAASLGAQWGFSVWESSHEPLRLGAAARSIAGSGASMKKAVQISLMEGRPCADRVENILQSLRREMHAHVERELSLLATRALKPLFACVAPALLGLLIFGMWQAWMHSMLEMGG